MRYAQVVLAQNGDHIARVKGQVVGRVALQHGFAQVERNKRIAEFLFVQPFDYGVVPIDLVHHVAQAPGYVAARALGGIGVLHQQVFAAVVVAGNQCITLRNQVQNLHAFKPAVPQGCSHRALQGDGIAKGRADAQQG